MQLVRDVFIKRSSPQIMDWIEFVKESGIDDECRKEYAKRFEESSYFPSTSLVISDESAIKQRSKLTFQKVGFWRPSIVKWSP